MAEPIDFDTAALHLRLGSDTSEQLLIEDILIPAARRYVENRSGLIIVQRSFVEEHSPAKGYLVLSKRPVVSIDPIDYTDSDGAEQVYEDARLSEGRVYPALNGSFPVPGIGGLRVTYTAGLTEDELANEDYSDLKPAILLLIGHWYANREAVNIGNIGNEVPLAVDSICDQYRSPGL